jgi:PHD/YefM family antitoxin component YafN of YafNO toxin-antitoxin module
MNTLTAQELEQRGLSAVEQALQAGPVHITDHDQPRYVVLTEERYRALLEAEDEAYVARVQASLADVEAGRVRRFDSVDALMQALEEDGEE